MDRFLQNAEGLLEVATAGEASAGDYAVILDRQGGIRLMDAAGWSLGGLAAEFGGDQVYLIEKRCDQVTVQGWCGNRYRTLRQETRVCHFGVPSQAIIPSFREVASVAAKDRSHKFETHIPSPER